MEGEGEPRAYSGPKRSDVLATGHDLALVDNAEILGRNQPPPAYVRPGDIPEPPVFGYGFEAMLAKL